jgi:hypothetical protein
VFGAERNGCIAALKQIAVSVRGGKIWRQNFVENNALQLIRDVAGSLP